MAGQLIEAGDDSPARCAICGEEAVGPCARCKSPVCGDCCVLTEGGSKVWAVCLRCERRGGRSLRAGWITVLVWIAGPLLALAALLLAIALVSHAVR
jgi:hypothetical protein